MELCSSYENHQIKGYSSGAVQLVLWQDTLSITIVLHSIRTKDLTIIRTSDQKIYIWVTFTIMNYIMQVTKYKYSVAEK